MYFLLFTNNPRVIEKYNYLQMVRLEGSVLELFILARDYIHRGHRLLTHPLSGSMKPGRIPYKSILLTAVREQLDLDSLSLIENSIETYHKFFNERFLDFPAAVLDDYSAVDLSHLEAALESKSY